MPYPSSTKQWARNFSACQGCEHHQPARPGRLDQCLHDPAQMVQCSAHAMRGTCPTGRQPHKAADAPKRTTHDVMAIIGPRLWKIWHEKMRGFDREKTPRDEVEGWVRNEFHRLIPCGECKSSLTAALAESPLPVGTTGRFEFSVEIHNFVNRKLGKPEMSVEDARKLYD